MLTILQRSRKKVCGNVTSFFSSEPFIPSSSWMRKLASARALSSCLHLHRDKGCKWFRIWMSKLGPARLVSTLCLCASCEWHSPLGQRLVGLLHFLRQISQVEFLPQGLNLRLIIGLKISHVSGVFFSQVLPQSEGARETWWLQVETQVDKLQVNNQHLMLWPSRNKQTWKLVFQYFKTVLC